MSSIEIQVVSLILGATFLFMSIRFSRKGEHTLAPAVIIIAAFFFFCGLFPIGGLIKTLVLEQVACWIVALAFLVPAFRFLQKEKISLAFTVFLLAAIFFFCSLSGVQSLLKTGMLSTVTKQLVKYGEQLNDLQLTMANMKKDLSDQQAQIEKQQNIVREAQLVVSIQQTNVANQNEHILGLQSVLAGAQSNVDKISAKVVEQQDRIDGHQKELENQQVKLREAQLDIGSQQGGLTNQFKQILQMQAELAVAHANIGKQQQKIEDVESLIRGLYSRTAFEVFSITDSSRVVVQSVDWKTTRILFKLKDVPIPNSVEGIQQSHVGVIRGLTGLVIGNPFSSQIPITGMGSVRNIAYTMWNIGKWDKLEFPGNATFIVRYIKAEQETNLVKKLELKGKDVFFDNQKQVFQ